MSYVATAVFKCDGCEVVNSEPFDLDAEALVPELPRRWLRVETSTIKRGHKVHLIKHYCPMCSPLITSYLAGRRGADAAD